MATNPEPDSPIQAKRKAAAPSYKRRFINKHGNIKAGAGFKKRTSFPTGTNKLLREVILLAKKNQGWTWPEMAYYLKIGQSPNTIEHRAPGILKTADMSRIRYDKYMALVSLAGISRPIGAVLYAQSCIPEEFPCDRAAIGLAFTTKFPSAKLQHCTDETVEFIKKNVRCKAKSVPQDITMIRSGMKLPEQKRKL